MSEIKRYDKPIMVQGLLPSITGEYVKYADYLAALKQARIKAVREIIEEYSYNILDAGHHTREVIDVSDLGDYLDHLEKAKGLNKHCNSSELKEQGE